MRDYSWLQNKRLPRGKRTSTWREGSPTAILGEAGEVVVVGRIQSVIDDLGLKWVVGRTGTHNSRVRELDFGPCPEDDIWTPINNSRQGDVHVVDHHGQRRFSFEVKASMEYPNVTISEQELSESEAEYLVGVTTAGLWVVTMEEAREKAYKKETWNASFWVIPFQGTEKVQLRDIFPIIMG